MGTAFYRREKQKHGSSVKESEGPSKRTNPPSAQVETGVMNEEFMEIVDGISTGDTVIVLGQNIVKDGSRVEIRGSND